MDVLISVALYSFYLYTIVWFRWCVWPIKGGQTQWPSWVHGYHLRKMITQPILSICITCSRLSFTLRFSLIDCPCTLKVVCCSKNFDEQFCLTCPLLLVYKVSSWNKPVIFKCIDSRYYNLCTFQCTSLFRGPNFAESAARTASNDQWSQCNGWGTRENAGVRCASDSIYGSRIDLWRA